MPHVNWSIDLGGMIMAVVALVFIPITRTLITTMWAMRDTLRDLGHIVIGTREDDSSALVTRMRAQEHEIRRHRDRLINLEAETGAKIQDRS